MTQPHRPGWPECPQTNRVLPKGTPRTTCATTRCPCGAPLDMPKVYARKLPCYGLGPATTIAASGNKPKAVAALLANSHWFQPCHPRQDPSRCRRLAGQGRRCHPPPILSSLFAVYASQQLSPAPPLMEAPSPTFAPASARSTTNCLTPLGNGLSGRRRRLE